MLNHKIKYKYNIYKYDYTYKYNYTYKNNIKYKHKLNTRA